MRNQGFSLVELVVVIAVVAVLISIWLPTVSRLRKQGDLIKWSAIMRQNAQLVLGYADSNRTFPVAYGQAWRCVSSWYEPLIRDGSITDASQLDPTLKHRPNGSISPLLSLTLVTHESNLRLSPSPPPNPRSFGVRVDMVSFPSDKGMMLRQAEDPEAINPTVFCCKFPGWPSPVAFADGSVKVATYYTLTGQSRPLIIDEIGLPILSTWGGYLGRDR